ncbi:MAG: ABC transporter permease subunit [Gemmatimonadetes bacterium]|nr:ABC transporter permease subunit [Gemmatimonadota bacterium]
MTDATAPSPRGTEELEGTVFDIGYQRYVGPREGRNRARWAVYKDGLRLALGLGRGARAKVIPWFFITLLGVIGLIMALIAGAVNTYIGPNAAEALDLPSHSDYYGIASIVFFVFAAVGAPEMLCPDRKDGVINLYLVRPLTGSDYVSARWLAFFTVMVSVAWLPQLILLAGLSLSNANPGDYLLENWLDIPRLLTAGLAMAAYTTSLAMFVASFTTRRAYASVFLVGLFVITAPFTTGLAAELAEDFENTAGQWVSMFNLSNIPVHVNDLIFDDVSLITSVAPAGEFSGWVLVGWYFLWTLVPAGLLWMRYRKLTP